MLIYGYVQLFLFGLIPVVLSIVFYLLQKKTPFGRMSYAAQQIIIGLCFGVVAIIGTEYGVDIGGTKANVRDAAPLCAGLFFGGPAGIIAGLIGGVERWFSVLWGVGQYSQVACSVSTALAGVYAALLRRYMFEKKAPGWGVSLAIGIVMEVFHMTMLLLTHISDVETAVAIVKICAIPMIVANGVSVVLASIAISLCSTELRRGKAKRYRPISQQVQRWLLVCVILAYVATTVFVFVLQTNTELRQSDKLLSLNVEDVRTDISEASDRKLLSVTRLITEQWENGTGRTLDEMAEEYGVAEINIVNDHGIITESTAPDYVGFDMNSGEQARAFMPLLNGQKEIVQSFQNVTKNIRNAAKARKYAGVALSAGGFVQVGYNYSQFRSDIAAQATNSTKNRRIGENGYIFVADNSLDIVGNMKGHEGARLSDTGLVLNGHQPETAFFAEVYGEPSRCFYAQAEGFYVVSVLPQSEVFGARDSAVYINSFMEVIVFAILFALIYFLIKGLVVDNIHSVNQSLGRIIDGDLNITVDVRTSDEFASLSDDINSTVTTLKHYIEEASARIDKELAFAKSIQHAALPSVFPAYPNREDFDIRATMDTAKEVGGDFYDFYMLSEDKLVFLVADVSGKGIPAAMFMMRAKTMLKNLAESGMGVEEVFTAANNRLCEGNEAGMFVTAFMCMLDLNTGHVTYANAGHNPPLLYRVGQGFKYLKCRPGFVLAGMEGIAYKVNEMDLSPGDRLYLYTDGVTEATSVEQELYGEDRLQTYLNTHVRDSAEQVLIGVKADLDAFAGEAEQFDDITMLMLDYHGKVGEREMDNWNEKVFPATDNALSDATAFVEEQLEANEVSMKVTMQMTVALEEIFVNVAHYAYPGRTGDVTLRMRVKGGEIRLQFRDEGIPFDPLVKTDPDITLSAEERRIGGLGIFMVKKTMDDVTYEYENGQNVLTLIKKY